jgi:hypothetical protein
MAKAIGGDRNLIAALSQAFFAVAIEFGSGVGFWLVFGHAGPRQRVEVEPPSQSTELVADDPPQKLIPVARSLPTDVARPRLRSQPVHYSNPGRTQRCRA